MVGIRQRPRVASAFAAALRSAAASRASHAAPGLAALPLPRRAPLRLVGAGRFGAARRIGARRIGTAHAGRSTNISANTSGRASRNASRRG
jgi:hypothetical protein